MDTHSLIEMLIYLGSAALIVPIAVRLGLGPVLGYLIAGCLIGPWGLKLVTDVESILHFAEIGVVLMLFGVWLFRPLLLKDEAPRVDRHLARLARWLAAVALLSGIAWALLITASMVGSAAAAFDPDTVARVLGNTFFGQVWRWHLLINTMLLALLFTPWRSSMPLRLGLSALLLATLAPVGHGAMLDGLSGQLLILNQIVHLTCVAAWLGGLLLLVMILRQPTEPMPAILQRFSGVGYALVAGLLITGLINVRVLTGQWAVISCAPFHCNPLIAERAKAAGKNRFEQVLHGQVASRC